MKKIFQALLLCCLVISDIACAGSLRVRAIPIPEEYVDFIYNEAMVSIHHLRMTWSNKEKSYCTGFIIGKVDDDNYMTTAGHCVLPNAKRKKGKMRLEKVEIYSNNSQNKWSYEAEVVIAVEIRGKTGQDFAFLRIKVKDRDFPILRFSENENLLGQCVFNVSFPAKADGNVFFGYAYVEIDKFGYVKARLKGIERAEGASGSPIFSCRTKEVIGIVVVKYDKKEMVGVIPISRFKELLWEIRR